MYRASQVLIAILPLLLLSACLTERSEDASGTLVISRENDATSLDPAATVLARDFAALTLIYDRLVKPETYQGVPTRNLSPGLATSWKSEEGGARWRFVLYEDRSFSDGGPVNAAAVKTSFERAISVGLGAASVLRNVDRIETVGDWEVVFHLSRPDPAFGLLMTLPFMGVVSPRVLEHQFKGDLGRSWLAENSAGSGSFMLYRWDRGQRITLRRNPYASADSANFDAIVIEVVRDEVTRIEKLLKKDVDIVERVSPDSIAYLNGADGGGSINIYSGDSGTLYLIDSNTERSIFKDVCMRQLLRKSIDVEDIALNLFKGYAAEVSGYFPASMLEEAPVDATAMARAPINCPASPGLITGAAPKITLTVTSGTALQRALAVGVLQSLVDAGFDASIETLSPAAYTEKVAVTGDFDLALRGYTADYPDGSIILGALFHSANKGLGGNRSRFDSAKFDALLDRAAVATGQERRRLYIEANDHISAQIPSVPLVYQKSILAMSSEIEGFSPNYWRPYEYNILEMRRVGPN